ncbi:MAG: hypothetical protein ACO34E_05315, partial [Limisphaerales bacterium]
MLPDLRGYYPPNEERNTPKAQQGVTKQHEHHDKTPSLPFRFVPDYFSRTICGGRFCHGVYHKPSHEAAQLASLRKSMADVILMGVEISNPDSAPVPYPKASFLRSLRVKSWGSL